MIEIITLMKYNIDVVKSINLNVAVYQLIHNKRLRTNYIYFSLFSSNYLQLICVHLLVLENIERNEVPCFDLIYLHECLIFLHAS